MLGIGLLVVLDGTYFELRFRAAEAMGQIATDYLWSLSRCILLTAILGLLTTAIAFVMIGELNAWVRSIIAAFGGALIVVAVVGKARPARP